MELIFPFRNLTINTFSTFLEKEKLKEFSDLQRDKDSWQKGYFESDIQQWRNYLPSFENEILQVINTTNQETIDSYFIELSAELKIIDERTDRGYLTEKISFWNDEILREYDEIVEKEAEDFSKHTNRVKKHLEKYEDWVFEGPLFGMSPMNGKKVEKTNYNFYCIEKIPDLINENEIENYIGVIKPLKDELFELSRKYGVPWNEGKIKSKIEGQVIPKPIVFVEGEHDIVFLNKAASYLNKTELLSKIELRQRGGFRNLDKLWNILKEESWETIPQVKIFLYDCDTNKTNEDFGIHYKRIIPTNTDCIIKKGIENLFSDEAINKAIEEKKAFVDFKKIIGSKRGIDYEEIQNEINKDEKRNFCEWICTNGSPEDFTNFKVIFDIIESLI